VCKCVCARAFFNKGGGVFSNRDLTLDWPYSYVAKKRQKKTTHKYRQRPRGRWRETVSEVHAI